MFVSFEGIDFCGKSTQVKLLAEYFEHAGKTVKIIREPGGASISEKIRQVLLDKKNTEMFIETEILLFSASRAQLVREVIIPALEDGIIVISDRYFDSTTAYQGYGRNIPLNVVDTINHFAVGAALPDMSFFLDIPIETAIERRDARRADLDRMERLDSDFFSRVRAGYKELSRQLQRFHLIDGTLPVDVIHRAIVEKIQFVCK
jgi:dTMP kinase